MSTAGTVLNPPPSRGQTIMAATIIIVPPAGTD
nr:MAG TPA: hypothetical protein [Caudoviricetes sp.]